MDINPRSVLTFGFTQLFCDSIKDLFLKEKGKITLSYDEKELTLTLRFDRQPLLLFSHCDHCIALAFAQKLELFPAHLEPFTTIWQGERPFVWIYAKESDEYGKELRSLMDKKGYRYKFDANTHNYEREISFGKSDRTTYAPFRIMEHLDAFAATYPGFLEQDLDKHA